MGRALRIAVLLKRAAISAVDHDCPNVAQSAAYSSIVALFPALILAAAVISLLPDTAPVRYELAVFFHRILPSDVVPLLQGYFVPSARTPTSARALIIAVLVSMTGASSVVVTFMEGLRRAFHLPPDCWSFWRRRRRAYALVPLALLPLAAASGLVVFGHLITLWLAMHVAPMIRATVYVAAVLIRWSVALTGSVGLIALLYHMGTPSRQPWRSTLPGAVVATLMWFLSTLAFGLYVTRFANYSRVYGSLGAGIALLVWLYIISFSILCGAEFNAQIAFETRPRGQDPGGTGQCSIDSATDGGSNAGTGTKISAVDMV